jgi:hypothetical protein
MTNAPEHARHGLLLGKLVFVSLYVGGLATVAVIWLTSRAWLLPAADPRRRWVLDLVGLLMVRFVVPCLLVVLLLGIALLLRSPRSYLGLRWVQVKLLALLIMIPTAHLYCRSRILILRDPARTPQVHVAAGRQLAGGILATLAGSVVIVTVGRLKPRLGQRSLP